MRKIKPSLDNSVNVLEKIGMRSAEPYKSLYAKKADDLKRIYKLYDAKMNQNAFENLNNSIFAPNETIVVNGTNYNCRSLMYNIYNNRRYMEIAEHYENVKENNGGGELLCPICDMEVAIELDYYIPRNVKCNPDYSIHIHNLIPLCHTCNLHKSNIWIKDDKRSFFNAYTDSLPKYDLFVCKISTKDDKGQLLEIPKVTIEMSQELSNGTSENELRIKETIKSTKLLEYGRYPATIRTKFIEELERIKRRYSLKESIISADAFWTEEILQYQKYLQPKVSNNMLEMLLYEALARNEQDVRDWFIANLQND